jgi:hypothetical protein
MAQILGESGRYVSQEAAGKRRAIWTLVMLFMVLNGFIVGFLIRGLFPGLRISSWGCILTTAALAPLICGAGTWTFRKVEELDKEPVNWQRGTDGEDLLARELAHTDKDFTEKAARNGRPRISAIVQTPGDKTNPPRASLTPNSAWSRTGRRGRLPD